MYAYDRALPSVNRLITDRMYQKSKEQHLKKLKSASCTIDNKRPDGYKGNKPKRNLKKEQMMEERLIVIERDNEILLRKMAKIMTKDNELLPSAEAAPKSLNKEFRQRELRRITTQNLMILKRIQKSEPTYSGDQWEQDRRTHEEYLRNIVIHKKSLPKLTSKTKSTGKLLRRPVTAISSEILNDFFSPDRPSTATCEINT